MAILGRAKTAAELLREAEAKSARSKANLDRLYFPSGHRQERPHPNPAVEAARQAVAELDGEGKLRAANTEWARQHGFLPK